MHAYDTVGGEAYLVRVAKNHPQVFCMLLARILPLQVSSRDGVPILPAPEPKIAETLELLRSRLGSPALQQAGQLVERERPSQAVNLGVQSVISKITN